MREHEIDMDTALEEAAEQHRGGLNRRLFLGGLGGLGGLGAATALT